MDNDIYQITEGPPTPAAARPTPIARIDDSPGVGKPVRDPAQIRERFMRGIDVCAS